MTIEAQLRASKTPQEAMLILARGLDQILELVTHEHTTTEDWFIGEWSGHQTPPSSSGPSVVHEDGGTTTIEIPPPSAEKKTHRRQFEDQVLHIGEYVGDPDTDFNDAYAKGGPTWLYNFSRDLVMSLPYGARQLMVVDLMDDDPQGAHEMARDILKQESTPGNALALADEFQGGVVGIRAAT